MIEEFHKSQNAPVPYPAAFHSEQKCIHFGALWDLDQVHSGVCELGQFNESSRCICKKNNIHNRNVKNETLVTYVWYCVKIKIILPPSVRSQCGTRFLGPIHWPSLIIHIPWKVYYPNSDTLIATKFCKWHDSSAAMVCTHNCVYLSFMTGITVKGNFIRFELQAKILSEMGPVSLIWRVAHSILANDRTAFCCKLYCHWLKVWVTATSWVRLGHWGLCS